VTEKNDSTNLAARLDRLYEFDRAPITEDRLHSGSYFAAMFAGEHVAATEFVIGSLFVQFGAGARDVLIGLLIGNLLAVLSWAFICAPIAVQVRLTLYWYLRRIAGPYGTVTYNIVNAVLYCILAGAMITVSASAVRIPFGVPAETDILPHSLSYVLVVLFVGSVVVTIAILGFKRLAQFAKICSPWMFLIFITGALATLPLLGKCTSLDDFWHIAKTQIWTGTRPDGEPPLGLGHMIFFAWICNLAMHIGLSDLAVFRYARHWAYGFYSAFGMYLGHYLAWVCAGAMGAAVAKVLSTPLGNLDTGEIAFQAAGIAGAIAVVIAGWTTANPTMYRAGLALQIATPNWPRWLVTLAAGAVTTMVACFPWVFRKLLGFVAIYGLALMPVGAIVFIEHWIFPRIGLKRFWGGRYAFNPAMLITWPAALGFCALLHFVCGMHVFYIWLPGWVFTAVVYTALAMALGAREGEVAPEEPAPPPPPPRPPAKAQQISKPIMWTGGVLAAASLAAMLGLAIWTFASGAEGTEQSKAAYRESFGIFRKWLILPTLTYFVGALMWASQREKEKGPEPTGAV